MSFLNVVLPKSLDFEAFGNFLQENNLWNIAEPHHPIVLETMGHEWIEPTPLAALAVAFCERKNKYQVEIFLNDFKGAKHPTYFERMGFFDLLKQQSPVTPGVHHDPSGRFIPIKVFDSLQDVDELKNKLQAFWGLIQALILLLLASWKKQCAMQSNMQERALGW